MDGARNLVNRCPLPFPLGLWVGDPLQLLFFPPQVRFSLFFAVFEK